MKFGEAVSLVGEKYVEEAMAEGGATYIDGADEVLKDFALYCKYTRDADVHDALTPDNVGTDRLHVLTEEEYILVFDFINEWGPSYLEGLMEFDDFGSDQESEEFDAKMEGLKKLLTRMTEDRGGNVDGD